MKAFDKTIAMNPADIVEKLQDVVSGKMPENQRPGFLKVVKRRHALHRNEALRIAVEENKERVAKLLVDLGTDLTIGRGLLFRKACSLGYISLVKWMLLVDGMDITALDNEAIRSAHAEKHGNVVDLLVRNTRIYESLTEEEREQFGVWANKTTLPLEMELHIYSKLPLRQFVRNVLCVRKSTATQKDLVNTHLIKYSMEEKSRLLIRSCKEGKFLVVKILLRSSDPTQDESQCLQRAGAGGYDEIVKRLLKDGRADPRSKGSRVLTTASEKGWANIVKMLLEDGRATPGEECLALAAKNGFHEVVELLLWDARCNPAPIAINKASENGHHKVVKLLLKDKRVDPTLNHNEAIRLATMNNHLEVIKVLMEDERVMPYKTRGREMLALVASNSEIGVAFTDNLLSPRERRDAFYTAIAKDDVPVVALLVDRFNPMEYDSLPLRVATRRGSNEVIRLLLSERGGGRFESASDPSANNNEPLLSSAQYNHPETLGLLLKDPRVDPRENDSQPLREGARRGNYEVVKALLIDERSDVHACGPVGGNALCESAENGNYETTRLLLKYDVDEESRSVATARALIGGHLKVAKLIIEETKNIDLAVDNNIAIRLASSCGRSRCVNFLLHRKEVDPTANNNQAVQNAYECGHHEVVRLLLKDKRVASSLTKEEKEEYKKMLC